MIFDLLTPPQGTRAGPKECAVHVSNLHTKFGCISANGLGGEIITDRQTDRQTEAILISPSRFFKKRVWG